MTKNQHYVWLSPFLVLVSGTKLDYFQCMLFHYHRAQWSLYYCTDVCVLHVIPVSQSTVKHILLHLQRGGVCIFVRKDLNVNKIDILQNCTEKDLETYAVELETGASKLIVLSIYRAPTGDFNQFLKKTRW